MEGIEVVSVVAPPLFPDFQGVEQKYYLMPDGSFRSSSAMLGGLEMSRDEFAAAVAENDRRIREEMDSAIDAAAAAAVEHSKAADHPWAGAPMAAPASVDTIPPAVVASVPQQLMEQLRAEMREEMLSLFKELRAQLAAQ